MRYLLLAALLPLACCGPKATSLDDFPTRPITLPGGQVIRIETMVSDFDLLRGMMFRMSVAPDHGMLFIYRKADHYQLWDVSNADPAGCRLAGLESRHR